MTISLQDEVVALLNDPSVIKLISTVDENGTPHTVVRDSISSDTTGNLFFLEYLESSQTNRNLVRSIWFDRKVSITLVASDGRIFEIKGIPIRTHISGPVFQKHYRELQERGKDVDLAAVWIIAPEEVRDESIVARQREAYTLHPNFIHLDRIVANI